MNNHDMQSLPRMHLLVAEDNAEWRTIITRILETHCDLVALVERGDLILEAAEKFRPELITLDVRLPGESGLNVLPRLRSLLPQAIIIIVTATTVPIYKEEAFARGANAFIEKWRVSSELVEAVSTAWERGSHRNGSHPII